MLWLSMMSVYCYCAVAHRCAGGTVQVGNLGEMQDAPKGHHPATTPQTSLCGFSPRLAYPQGIAECLSAEQTCWPSSELDITQSEVRDCGAKTAPPHLMHHVSPQGIQQHSTHSAGRMVEFSYSFSIGESTTNLSQFSTTVVLMPSMTGNTLWPDNYRQFSFWFRCHTESRCPHIDHV